jgi:ABC-type uncharacterized transport system auxiliary subunit
VPPQPSDSALQDGTTRVLIPGSIAILVYTAPGLYGDNGIVYRIDDSAYGAYANREWALPVSVMLGMLTEDVLRAHPISVERAVFDPPSPHGYTFIWRGIVRELEEVDRGTHVFASVRLDARLTRARDDSVLWSGTLRLERPVPEGTMPAIVDALSRLAADVISHLVDQARDAVAVPAASAARERAPHATLHR